MIDHLDQDIRIKAKIPYLKAKTVLLLEDPANPIPVPNPLFWEDVKEHLKWKGYKFISIQNLLTSINPVIAAYCFPGYDIPDGNYVYRQIRETAGIACRNGFLYKRRRDIIFEDVCNQDITKSVQRLVNILDEETDPFIYSGERLKGKKVRAQKTKKRPSFFSILWEEIERSSLDLYDKAHTSLPEPEYTHPEIEEELDERTQKILSDVRRLLQDNNLTLEELRFIIGYKVKLSHMGITRGGKIFLSDFLDDETGNPIEIKMDALTKMVYFFYLKHPEGVRIKDVDRHIDELMHIYMGITGRDDKDAIRASILGHVAPYSNSINVSMSRIKSAFRNRVDTAVARFYWIEGTGGEPYKIAIDRDYVLWEH